MEEKSSEEKSSASKTQKERVFDFFKSFKTINILKIIRQILNVILTTEIILLFLLFTAIFFKLDFNIFFKLGFGKWFIGLITFSSLLTIFFTWFFKKVYPKICKKVKIFLGRALSAEEISEYAGELMEIWWRFAISILSLVIVWGIISGGNVPNIVVLLLFSLIFLFGLLTLLLIYFGNKNAFILGVKSLDNLIKNGNLKEIDPYYDIYWYLDKAIRGLCDSPYFTDFPIEELKFKDRDLNEFDLDSILDAVQCVCNYGDKATLKNLRDRMEVLRNLSNEDIWNGKEILKELLELKEFTSEFLKEIKIQPKSKAPWYDSIIAKHSEVFKLIVPLVAYIVYFIIQSYLP